MAEAERCGYVAVVGATNAGKSTLVNALVGSKVSIVSPKVQTTRSRVLGIALSGRTQIILVDTPGIFRPRRRLDRAMIMAAWDGMADAETICLVLDARRGYDEDSRSIVERLKQAERKAILVMNKVDLISRKETLLALADEVAASGCVEGIFMVSALTEDGLDALRETLVSTLPEGPWLFPEDQLSDLPQRLLAAEITREKAFFRLHDELPYALMVDGDRWLEQEDGSVRIDQTLYVQRESQKGIVVGKGGQTIRAIGTAARAELQALLERPVHLFLHVKVRENWAERRENFADLGLAFNV